MKGADIGIIGLGIMGQNISLNFERNGFSVSVYNRNMPPDENRRSAEFIETKCRDKRIKRLENIGEFIRSISKPRKIILMITAGASVDQIITELLPGLEPGDIIIDGGNSYYSDTDRRLGMLEEHGIAFIGAGISGGEWGALNGPSIMPGGSSNVRMIIESVFQAISARLDDGSPCCKWIGPGGSGHFVKMTHNGIEYGIMQLIAESYDIMRRVLNMSVNEIAGVFGQWNSGIGASYLLDITVEVLRRNDADGCPLIDKILDSANDKGSGRSMINAAMELGVPAPTISAAISARLQSMNREKRAEISKAYSLNAGSLTKNGEILGDLKESYFLSLLTVFEQGLELLYAASEKYEWRLNLADIVSVWKGGCIIQGGILNTIENALKQSQSLPFFINNQSLFQLFLNGDSPWRRVISVATSTGIPIPAISASLAWIDTMRSERLPASLIQAQRDYFGAHTYERIDRARGEFFHTRWKD